MLAGSERRLDTAPPPTFSADIPKAGFAIRGYAGHPQSYPQYRDLLWIVS
jgi:hypothetical protein